MSDGGHLHPLVEDQRAAVVPDSTIWLSASAGTGKTQVLTARVFRLLLTPGVRPEHILCLTFTKAAAAEMADRISSQLARWVRASDTELGKDLAAIGADIGPKAVKQARTLFAAVLDAPGGGIAIQTIHSFCQSLLASFPIEAGIAPGFAALDEREAGQLTDATLEALLVEAEQAADAELFATVQDLALSLGEAGFMDFLQRCAARPDLWKYPDRPLAPLLRRGLGLETDDSLEALAELLGQGLVPDAMLPALVAANRQWGTKTGLGHCDVIARWQGSDGAGRLAMLDELALCVLTAKGEPRKVSPGQLKAEPDYDNLAQGLIEAVQAVQQKRALIELVERMVPALELGRRFGALFDRRKRRDGVLDFDDLIRNAAELLLDSTMAAWIRYKLDRRYDHILVDESQDTNALQWQIVAGLTSDFFAGEGATERQRTLFTVGDFKQAIYSFQGTNPIFYQAARDTFQRVISQSERRMNELSLARSFRSAQTMLDFVDLCLGHLGHQALHLPDPSPPHHGQKFPGSVTLWSAVGADYADGHCHSDSAGEGAEGWMSQPDRELADNIAAQVDDWLERGLRLNKGETPRPATPGDIMILLRKRGDLARLIVARLYARGIAVAGIDRLRVGQPLVVRDLCAAGRFTLQPHDDLNLANLLVSPLIGWSHDRLDEAAHRPNHLGLWEHLRQTLADDDPGIQRLRALLAMADYDTPYGFFEQLLSGPLRGRARLIARLGTECLDPLDEFLSIAQGFERDHHPTMQNFLHWFEASDTDIKRDIKGADEVRVMTVHGAKGLQAPIVILADSAIDPHASPVRSVDLMLTDDFGETATLPLLPVPKAERSGAVAEAYAREEDLAMAEHWRLAYVAMTRAEERLYLAGTVNGRTGMVAANSWHALASQVMQQQGIGAKEDPIWGDQQHYGDMLHFLATAPGNAGSVADHVDSLPQWAITPAPEEARPPRPLAPSALGEDGWASPPVNSSAMRKAAERGVLLHALFERLPDVVTEERSERAAAWLERRAQGFTHAERADMISSVLAIIDAAEFAPLFGPQSRAEVPLAVPVDDQVISGTIDRLLIGETEVTAIDFKTGRNPPDNTDAVPAAHLRQMAAYGLALRHIYPDHRVRLGLLYTSNATMLWPDETALTDIAKEWV
ncbi:MAG: double-strand break repair helicase AddA [Pseudomonadota bacterium]